MVKVIVVKTVGDLQHAIKTLGRIKRKLPEMTRLGMRRWGKILERDMKLSLRKVTSVFSGVSQNRGIRWEQSKRSDVGKLFMRREYLAVDHMKPHWVNVTRSRSRLLMWAKQSRNFKGRAKMVETKQIRKFSIFVRPHPFIANGFRRARPKLKAVLRRVAARGVEV